MKIDTLINLSPQSFHHSYIFWCSCGNFLVEIHWLRLYPRLYLYNLCSYSGSGGNYNFTERKKWKTDNVRLRAIGRILWSQEHAFISTTWNLFCNALHCKIWITLLNFLYLWLPLISTAMWHTNSLFLFMGHWYRKYVSIMPILVTKECDSWTLNILGGRESPCPH